MYIRLIIIPSKAKKNASWHFQPEWEWEGQEIFFATWASPPPNTKTIKDWNGMGDMSYQANVAYMYSFGPTHCRTPCRTHCSTPCYDEGIAQDTSEDTLFRTRCYSEVLAQDSAGHLAGHTVQHTVLWQRDTASASASTSGNSGPRPEPERSQFLDGENEQPQLQQSWF